MDRPHAERTNIQTRLIKIRWAEQTDSQINGQTYGQKDRLTDQYLDGQTGVDKQRTGKEYSHCGSNVANWF
jgi:hypothetical protein